MESVLSKSKHCDQCEKLKVEIRALQSANDTLHSTATTFLWEIQQLEGAKEKFLEFKNSEEYKF